MMEMKDVEEKRFEVEIEYAKRQDPCATNP